MHPCGTLESTKISFSQVNCNPEWYGCFDSGLKGTHGIVCKKEVLVGRGVVVLVVLLVVGKGRDDGHDGIRCKKCVESLGSLWM